MGLLRWVKRLQRAPLSIQLRQRLSAPNGVRTLGRLAARGRRTIIAMSKILTDRVRDIPSSCDRTLVCIGPLRARIAASLLETGRLSAMDSSMFDHHVPAMGVLRSPRAASGARYASLDGLRGVLAAFVMLAHFQQSAGHPGLLPF